MRSLLIRWILTLTALVGLPLAGVMLNGQRVQAYLEFPPLTRYVAHAPFSWWAFGMIAALDAAMLAGMAGLFKGADDKSDHPKSLVRHPFPLWGWMGAGIMLAGWCLAWTRMAWFAPLQHHTFSLPWAGYILLANAWCVQRSGNSLLTEAPGRFLLLLPASAAFWWFFEFLNRMVQNWSYTGVDDFGPGEYTFFASLAFATVLPAVLSTHRLLLTWPLFDPALTKRLPLRLPDTPGAAALLLLASVAGLTLISRFPDYLYPLVWIAPLLVITALQTLWKQATIFTPLRRGDWRALVAAAVAALICGFFWELWNFHSMARWEYAVPFVNRFHIFAMPVLGYGGYLPFGLECLVAGRMVMGDQRLGLGP
jgi:hypothetical protein